MKIEIDGKSVVVEYLGGQPWYVQVRSPKTGFWRTIWHRTNGRQMGDFARLAVVTANAAS